MNTLWLESGWKSKSAGLAGAAKTWWLGFQCLPSSQPGWKKCRGINYKDSACMQLSHHPVLGWDANLSLWEIFNFGRGSSLILTWYVRWIYTCRYKYTRFLYIENGCICIKYIQFLFSYQKGDARYMYISHRENTTFLVLRRWNKDLTSAVVLFLFPYNLFCCHQFIGIKDVLIF